MEDALNYKLRLLCGTAMDALWQEHLPTGIYDIASCRFLPENCLVGVTCESRWSDDKLFYYLKTEAAADGLVGAVQQLRKVEASFPSSFREWGGRYALVSRGDILGAEYLQEGLYASNEEVVIPSFGFLYQISTAPQSQESVFADGLAPFIRYSKSSTALGFPSCDVHGEGFIINHGSINLPPRIHFYDRLVLVSEAGNLRIGAGAILDKALIIAYGTVTIEPGCRVNGLIIAKQLEVQGSSEFSADADVVAPFTSACYLNVDIA